MVRLKKGIAQITDVGIAVIIIIAIMAFIVGPLISTFNDEARLNIAASHAKKVEEATNKYIADNYAVISGSTSPTTFYNLTVPMLINAGYLPNGFSETNNYTSTYRTIISQPTTNKFHSMTFLTGGANLSMSKARKFATYIGASGGYIEGGLAKGAQGSWTENLSAFGGFNPGDGHIVISGFYINGAVVNDYLYRKAVPGHPELNTMSTALNMGSNDVNAINNLQANGSATVNGSVTSNSVTTNQARVNGDASVGGTVTSTNAQINSNANISGIMTAGQSRSNGETYTAGWFRTTGDTGWYSEKWGGGLYMLDSTWIRAYAGKSIYTAGEMRGGTVSSDGRLTAGEFVQINGVANVGGACSPNGLFGRDASGSMLSCISGVWTAPGKLKEFEQIVGAGACGRYVYSNAYCPAGKQLISGGYVLSRWGGDGWNAPDSNGPSPDGRGWQILTGGGVSGGSCISAIAWCATN